MATSTSDSITIALNVDMVAIVRPLPGSRVVVEFWSVDEDADPDVLLHSAEMTMGGAHLLAAALPVALSWSTE